MPDAIFTISPPLEPAETGPDLILIDGFWPAIDQAQFRLAMRLTDEVTPERARSALINAISSALIDLVDWQIDKIAEGFDTLDMVPAPQIDGHSRLEHLWQRAIFALAKAELVETYRDYDATGAGERNSDFVDGSIAHHQRDAAHAIRDLKGRPRTTVDLI